MATWLYFQQLLQANHKESIIALYYWLSSDAEIEKNCEKEWKDTDTEFRLPRHWNENIVTLTLMATDEDRVKMTFPCRYEYN